MDNGEAFEPLSIDRAMMPRWAGMGKLGYGGFAPILAVLRRVEPKFRPALSRYGLSAGTLSHRSLLASCRMDGHTDGRTRGAWSCGT